MCLGTGIVIGAFSQPRVHLPPVALPREGEADMFRSHLTHAAMCTWNHQLQSDWHPEWGAAEWDMEAHRRPPILLHGIVDGSGGRQLGRGPQKARQSPLLASLCGWCTPDAIPPIGTIYGFLRSGCVPEAHPRQGVRRSGRRLKLKAGQKIPTRLGGKW